MGRQISSRRSPPAPAKAPRMSRYRSFRDFWPHYLREHKRPATRRLHYAGTGLVLLIALAALATGDWRLLVALPARRLRLRLVQPRRRRAQPAGDLHLSALVAGRRLQDGLAVGDRTARRRARRGRGRARAAEGCARWRLSSPTPMPPRRSPACFSSCGRGTWSAPRRRRCFAPPSRRYASIRPAGPSSGTGPRSAPRPCSSRGSSAATRTSPTASARSWSSTSPATSSTCTASSSSSSTTMSGR